MFVLTFQTQTTWRGSKSKHAVESGAAPVFPQADPLIGEKKKKKIFLTTLPSHQITVSGKCSC